MQAEPVGAVRVVEVARREDEVGTDGGKELRMTERSPSPSCLLLPGLAW